MQTFVKYNRKAAIWSSKTPDSHCRSQMTSCCAHLCSHASWCWQKWCDHPAE